MTHAELAKALHLARSTVTRDVPQECRSTLEALKNGEPNTRTLWAKRLDRKRSTKEREENEQVGLPNWLRQEHREYLLSKQIGDLMLAIPRTANQDNELTALRAKYELIADAVLDDHLDLIDAALIRRLLTCGGFSKDEATDKYLAGLTELVERSLAIEADDEVEEPETP
jgi:hypothetical protein